MIYCANTELGKRVSIQKFWPLFTDKKLSTDRFIWGDTIEEARENYRKTLQAHNKLN